MDNPIGSTFLTCSSGCTHRQACDRSRTTRSLKRPNHSCFSRSTRLADRRGLVVCCFPVGLILVWLHPRMSQATKWIITGVVGVLVLAMVAANLVKPQGHTDKPPAKDKKAKQKDRYTAPYDDFDGESDRLLRSDDFLSKPTGAKDLISERLTGDFLPFSPGAESYYRQYAFLGGIAWTEDRKEDHPDGSVRQFTTTFGVALGDGTRRTTKKDFPGKESVRYRRRERDGRIEFGMESVAGQGVVHWTPLIKLDARQGDSWTSLLGDTDKPQRMTRLTNMFEFDGRACAVIVEERDQGTPPMAVLGVPGTVTGFSWGSASCGTK